MDLDAVMAPLDWHFAQGPDLALFRAWGSLTPDG